MRAAAHAESLLRFLAIRKGGYSGAVIRGWGRERGLSTGQVDELLQALNEKGLVVPDQKRPVPWWRLTDRLGGVGRATPAEPAKGVEEAPIPEVPQNRPLLPPKEPGGTPTAPRPPKGRPGAALGPLATARDPETLMARCLVAAPDRVTALLEGLPVSERRLAHHLVNRLRELAVEQVTAQQQLVQTLRLLVQAPQQAPKQRGQPAPAGLLRVAKKRTEDADNRLLAVLGAEELSLADLQIRSGVAHCTIWRRVKAMLKAGSLSQRREGRRVFYRRAM